MAGVVFDVNTALYKSTLEMASAEGTIAVAEQARTDSNYFVREDQSTLKQSADVEREGNNAALTYNTSYAAEVYMTGTPSHDVNPNATLMWIETAYKKFKNDWNAIMQKAFNRRLGG